MDDVNSTIPGPNDIIFTQFLRPDGKRRMVWFPATPDLKAKASKLIDAGFQFECEELQTGRVYLDCCNSDEQLVSKLVPNDEEIPKVVEALIERAYAIFKRREPMKLSNQIVDIALKIKAISENLSDEEWEKRNPIKSMNPEQKEAFVGKQVAAIISLEEALKNLKELSSLMGEVEC